MSLDAREEVKARLDIVDIVGSYVQLVRSGRENKGLCPFHSEKSPSFSVSQEKQVFYCHGCGEGGDIFDFIQKIERTDFLSALHLLADRAGVEVEERGGQQRGAAKRRKRVLELNAKAQLFFAHVLWTLPAGAPGRELLRERGVTEEVARRFGAGFAPSGGQSEDALVRALVARAGATGEEIVDAGLAHPSRRGGGRDRFRHRLVFPIRDEHGATLGFGARALGDAVPKYLNSPETAAYHKSLALFGIDLARDAIRESGAATVVEGYFDVIAAHSAGVPNAVASSGTAFTPEQAKMIGRYAKEVVFCFDADSAGRVAASRAVDVAAAASLGARIVTLPDGFKDPDELVRSAPADYAAAVAAALPAWQVLLNEALSEGEGRGAEAQAQAAARAIAVLHRIPEASVRDLYVQQVVRRLELSEAALRADLARAGRDGPPRTTRVVAPPPGPPTAPPEAAEEPVAIPEPDPWEWIIAASVVNRPEVARLLVTDLAMGVGEIENPAVRRLVEVALDIPGGAEFPLHALSSAERSLASRLLMAPPPELDPRADPGALLESLRAAVRLVREGHLRVEITAVRRALRVARDAGRDEEVIELAGKLSRLAQGAPHLRRRV